MIYAGGLENGYLIAKRIEKYPENTKKITTLKLSSNDGSLNYQKSKNKKL